MASVGDQSSPFEGIDITADEVQRIEKALKNEEFRKLFVEYAQEISDPENRRKYEAELTELERSRGMDVKFLHPKPGYVLKTSVDGEKKAFINVCMNENISKPNAENSTRGSGAEMKAGVQWTLPHSLAPGRDDLDHAGKKCVVYDCLFNPECFAHVDKDKRFRTLLENTAMDGIEREFHVTLDRNNIKRPKMKFKGRAQATVMRTPRKEGPSGENSLDALNIKYPYNESEQDKKVPNKATKSASKISGNRGEVKSNMSSNEKKPEAKKNGFTEPKYSLIHRGHFDMQQYTNARDSMPSTRPQELIVKVDLPLMKSAATVQLDVFERSLHLECKKPVSYRLDLALPFPVDEEKGSAKFDKSKACLTVTLTVLPPEIPEVPSISESSNIKPLVEEIGASNIPSEDSSLRTNDKPSNESVDVEEKENQDAKAVELETKLQSKSNKGGNVAMEITSEEAQRDEMTDASKEIVPNHEPESEDAKRMADDSPATPCLSNQSPDGDHAVGPESTQILPRYDFYQTEEIITLIIRETSIDPKMLSAVVTDGGRAMNVACKKLDSSSEGIFGIVILCNEGQTMDEEVKSDVSDTNAVLMMKKKEGCGSLWAGFKAGLSNETLEEKRFLTDASLDDLLSCVIEEQPTSKETEPCLVTQFSAESVKAEFEVTMKADSNSQVVMQPKEEKKSAKETGSILPALNLEKVADMDDESSHCSDSQSTPPSSSGPPGLKSALRSPRRRAYKSVSFSEEVLVEMFLEGPKSGRQQKGGKQKKKGGRRAPFFGPRRMIEKLKDNSWESYSDSELLHGNRDGHMEEDEDHEGSEWDWRPDQVLMRQSSSESESGLEVPHSPRAKGKKSKGSRRRRKEKARREANVDANQASENSEGNEKVGNTEPVSKTQVESGNDIVSDNNNMSSKTENSMDISDVTNNNQKNKEGEEEVPLEMQDHSTKCAFEFSNQVIFDLDE